MLNQSKRVVKSKYESLDTSVELSRTRSRRQMKRKARKRFSHTAVLALCLVSGLTIGVGSAFASDDKPPDKFPSLQPAANVKLEEELNLPPKDPEVNSSTKNVEQKKMDSKKEKESNTYTTNEKNEDYDKIKEKPKNSSDGVNNSSTMPDSAKKEPQVVAKQKEKEQVNRANATEKKAANSVNEKNQQTAGSRNGTKKAVTTNPPSKTPASDQQAYAKNGSDSSTTKPTIPSKKPTTEKGGKLPDTAGRDLEGVIFGAFVALLGSLYILFKDKGRKVVKRK
ncbi:hypothetical protein [Thermoflavimicrobium daqui]|uniref:LPXTG cell wall anchor domain-containing protein n=1 Tax=Thermoflavimicrobium daqui TaxID=2137476 RepID=A0A364K9T4_9BACL|nr:hypothetical protein [Thermoflavimicrobium daqui]RAL27038.1 hypothetical protein DL897_03100 [Thermoflavimicrobium daqui]